MPRVIGGALALVAVAISLQGGVLERVPLWMLVLPVLTGIGIAWQQATNGRLRQRVGTPLTATLVNFIGGTIVLAIAAAIHVAIVGMPAGLPTEPWLYLGGVVGVTYIFLSAALVVHTGVLILGLGAVAGQLVTAFTLDALWPADAGPGWLVELLTVVVAAGSGARLDADRPKAFVGIDEHTVLRHALRGVFAAPYAQVVVVAPAAHVGDALTEIGETAGDRRDIASVVVGGRTRQQSVAAGLSAVWPDVEFVLVHDAARALTPPAVFSRVIAALEDGRDAVLPVLPVVDTLKRVAADAVVEAVDRASLAAAQTPQGFRRDILQAAYAAASADLVKLSDEDAAWLYPGLGDTEVLEQIAAYGPRVVVMTRGGAGAIGLGPGGVAEVPALAVSVADTIGAGDAYMASLISSALDDAAVFDDPALFRSALQRAAVTAGITVSRAGANPPTRAEVDAALSA